MKRTFIETKYFTAKWQGLCFTEEDLRRLQEELLENPKVGDVMCGTGGLRKMRFAYNNRGKSGSARVCYLDIEIREEIHLLDVFAKSEKENLSKAERNNIKKLVEFIKEFG